VNLRPSEASLLYFPEFIGGLSLISPQPRAPDHQRVFQRLVDQRQAAGLDEGDRQIDVIRRADRLQ
jgi:hypothetical protein